MLVVLRQFADMSGDHSGPTEDVVSGERLFVVEGVADFAAACHETVACTGRLCCCLPPKCKARMHRLSLSWPQEATFEIFSDQ